MTGRERIKGSDQTLAEDFESVCESAADWKRLAQEKSHQVVALRAALELGRRFEREYQRMTGATWHASAQMYLDKCQREFMAAYTEALK